MKLYILILIFFTTYINCNQIDKVIEETILCVKTIKEEKCLGPLSEAINIDLNNSTLYTIRGLQYIGLSKYKKAIADFNISINIESNNSTVFGFRGQAYLNLLQYEKAIKDINKALALNPKNALAYLQKGMYFWHIKNMKDALYNVNMAVNLDSNNTQLLSTRGMFYYEIERFENAIQDFSKVINKDKNSTNNFLLKNAYIYRATCYQSLKDTKNAINDYSMLIAMSPHDNIKYYNQRAILYTNAKSFYKAMYDLNKVFEEDENNTLAHYNMAVNYNNIKQYKKAILEYTYIIEKDTNSDEHELINNAYINRDDLWIQEENNDTFAVLNQGINNFNNKHYKQAILDFTYFINENKDYTRAKALKNAYENRALSYYRAGDFKNSIDDYDKLIELYPNNDAFYLDISNGYYSLGKHTKAINTLTQAIRMHGLNNDLLLEARASIYSNIGEYDKAIKDIITLDANSSSILAIRALTYRKTKQYDKALTDFKTIINQDTNWTTISVCYTNIADIFLQKKKYKKSIEQYKKAIQLSREKKISKNLSVSYFGLAHSYYLSNQPYLSIKYYAKGILCEKNLFNLLDYIDLDIVLMTIREKYKDLF